MEATAAEEQVVFLRDTGEDTTEITSQAKAARATAIMVTELAERARMRATAATIDELVVKSAVAKRLPTTEELLNVLIEAEAELIALKSGLMDAGTEDKAGDDQ